MSVYTVQWSHKPLQKNGKQKDGKQLRANLLWKTKKWKTKYGKQIPILIYK